MKKTLLFLVLIGFSILSYAQLDVDVAGGGQMYISKSAYVYVSNTGDVNVNATGQLIMDSDSNEFANLYVDGASTGNTSEYWRHTASVATRDLITAPVSGEVVSAFFTRNGPSGLDIIADGTHGGDYLFGRYLNTSTTGLYEEYTASVSSTTSYTLDAGIGYRAATDSGQNLQFKGAISTGDVNVDITFGGDYPAARYGESNLIGNPYCTYISAVDLLAALTQPACSIDDAYTYIYAYDGSVTGNDGSTWERINNAYIATLPGSPGDINIAPGQAFLVYSNTGTVGTMGTLTFTKSMQRVLTDGDDFIAGRSAPNSGPLNVNLDADFRIKIENIANSKSDDTQLYFFDNKVSRGLDIAWDAGALSVSNFSISTLLAEDNEGIAFDLQCLDSSDITDISSDLIIPLHINAAAGVNYKISLAHKNIPSGATIYLYDALKDSYTLLNNESYLFNPSVALAGAGRFYIRTSNNSLSNDDYAFNSLNVKSMVNLKTLLVEGQLISETKLNLYDSSGRLIRVYNLNSDLQPNERYIDVSDVSEGVYIAQLKTSSHQIKSNKVIIR